MAAPTAKRRNRPLAGLEQAVLAKIDAHAGGRVEGAISTLENVIALRDAGQHTAAGEKAVLALRELGVAYPPLDWDFTWQSIAAQTIAALNAIREELSSD